MNSTATLKIASLFQVPFDNYPKDFTFIVNNEEFQTNKIIADLLSQKISRHHRSDPLLDRYAFRTQESGNFQNILDIVKTGQININSNELPFFTETFDHLEINFNVTNHIEGENTVDNVLDRIKVHEKSPTFYSEILNEEIEFASENFYSLKENQEEKLLALSESTIEKILSSPKLQLENENQLLDFINRLYQTDPSYSKFYGFVWFLNVESSAIEQFLAVFSIEDITGSTWDAISMRLKQKIELDDRNSHNKNRYIKRELDLSFKGQEFKGIFYHFRNQSSINDEVNLTASSHGSGSLDNLLQFDQTNYFYTKDSPNSWICFEFKNHSIIPTHYTLRSEISNRVNGSHPKSWVVEVSNNSSDSNSWVKIDEQTDNSSLNGSRLVHTFSIQNHVSVGYKYLRIRLTGPTWNRSNLFLLDSVELYGCVL